MVTGRSQARARARPHPANARPLVSRLAMGFGGLFVVFGLLGFLPGVTNNVGAMTVAGPGSGAELLGAFQVSVLRNAVHLGFGVAGLLLGRTGRGARIYLLGGGAAYLGLWLAGLAIAPDSGANLMPLGRADGWLHAVSGGGMLALGALGSRNGSSRR
ncbi:DUF4383 domain-containing protein [Plantactinospora sp. GCM10030261]|uniref:DUF4383 domain-containing protein n=1 Tax=Plantactinospora sp. GCM10030261 TaxID=3273420 RepID=UPI0036138656